MSRQLAEQAARLGIDLAQALPDFRRVETRPALRRRGGRAKPNRKTEGRYATWRRRYQQWCPTQGYQPDLLFLSDERVVEYVHTLIEGDDPYAANTVRTAISALRYWAQREGTAPMPTFVPAYDLVNTFASSLPAVGLTPAKRGPRATSSQGVPGGRHAVHNSTK